MLGLLKYAFYIITTYKHQKYYFQAFQQGCIKLIKSDINKIKKINKNVFIKES